MWILQNPRETLDLDNQLLRHTQVRSPRSGLSHFASYLGLVLDRGFGRLASPLFIWPTAYLPRGAAESHATTRDGVLGL